MDSEIIIELIKLIPSLLGFFLVIVLIIIFYNPIRYELIPRMGSFKAFGIEASFIEKIKTTLEKTADRRKIVIDHVASSIVAERAGRLAPLIKGRRIMWIDDNPENNDLETDILESLGLIIYPVTNSEDASRLLSQRPYDLIISDIRREGKPDEGVRFLQQFVTNQTNCNLIFFAANIDPYRGVPPHAFGMTNRVDELLHLVFDALERNELMEKY